MKNDDGRQASHGSPRQALQKVEFQIWFWRRPCLALHQQGVCDVPKIVHDIANEIEALKNDGPLIAYFLVTRQGP
jgi:hypothetical protein